MGIHDISIDNLLKGMRSTKKRNQLRVRILHLIRDFNNGDAPKGGNVKSITDARRKKEIGITQLIT